MVLLFLRTRASISPALRGHCEAGYARGASNSNPSSMSTLLVLEPDHPEPNDATTAESVGVGAGYPPRAPAIEQNPHYNQGKAFQRTAGIGTLWGF